MKKIIALLIIMLLGASAYILTKQSDNNPVSNLTEQETDQIFGCGGKISCQNQQENFTQTNIASSISTTESAQELADQGKSTEEIINFLSEDPKVSNISTGPQLIIFNYENAGLRAVELIDPFLVKNFNHSSNFLSLPTKTSSTNTSLISTAKAQSQSEVVTAGSQRGLDNREEKKALIFSPTNWFSTIQEETSMVENILSQNRAYDGNVTLMANSSKGSNDLDYNSFLNWDGYDLVYFKGIAGFACLQSKQGQTIKALKGNEDKSKGICATFFHTGYKFNSVQEGLDFISKIKATPENTYFNPIVSKSSIYFPISFLSKQAPSKYENSVVHFSLNDVNFSEKFAPFFNQKLNNSSLFYWDVSVEESSHKKATKELYERMIVKGLNSDKAYDDMPADSKTAKGAIITRVVENQEFKEINQTGAIGTFAHDTDKGGVHLIETITNLHPETEQELQGGETISIQGTLGDGKPDKINLMVELEGYTRSEIDQKNLQVEILIDSETIVSKTGINNNSQITAKPGNHEFSTLVNLNDYTIPDKKKGSEIVIEAKFYHNSSDFGYHKSVLKTQGDDIKATLAGGTWTYDSDTGVMLVNSPEGNFYMDDAGFTYINEGGWKKVNMNFGFSVGISSSSIDSLGNNTGTNLPVVNIAQKASYNQLQQKGYKFNEVDCSEGKCEQTTLPDGAKLTFAPSKKLITVQVQGETINYEYGQYSIEAPEATEQVIPDSIKNFNFGNLGEYSDLNNLDIQGKPTEAEIDIIEDSAKQFEQDFQQGGGTNLEDLQDLIPEDFPTDIDLGNFNIPSI